jgi:hypothetical protein
MINRLRNTLNDLIPAKALEWLRMRFDAPGRVEKAENPLELVHNSQIGTNCRFELATELGRF